MKSLICFILLSSIIACSPEKSKVEVSKLQVDASLDFGEVDHLSPAPIKTLNLINDESSTLALVPEISNTSFQIVYSTCASVKKGKSCTLKILMKTDVVGEKTAILSIGNEEVSLSGEVKSLNGSGPSYVFKLNEDIVSSVDFGISSKNVIKIISVVNDGTNGDSIPSVSVSSGFSIVSNSCTKALKKNDVCSVKVLFNPKEGHQDPEVEGELTVESSVLDLVAEVDTSSSGLSDIKFYKGIQEVVVDDLGAVSSQVIISYTAKNEGQGISLPVAVNLSSASYTLVFNTCEGKSLKAGQTCLLKVLFNPRGKAPNIYLVDVSIGSNSFSISSEIEGDPTEFQLAITPNGGGITVENYLSEDTPSELYTFASGSTAKITVSSPSFGERLDAWGGDCAGETSSICEILMDGNKSVSVSFTTCSPGDHVLYPECPEEYIIGLKTGVSYPSGTGILLSHTGVFPVGSNITIDATETEDYVLYDWVTPSSCQGEGASCLYVLAENTEVEATFTEALKDMAGNYNLDTNLKLLTAPLKAEEGDCLRMAGWLIGVNGILDSLIDYEVHVDNDLSTTPGGIALYEDRFCANPVSGIPVNTGSNYEFGVETLSPGLYGVKIEAGDKSIEFQIDVDKETGYKQVSISHKHLCVSTNQNEAYCVGAGVDYEKGNGLNTQNTNLTKTVQGGQSINSMRYIGAGTEYGCGINSFNNQVYCWGFNSSGRTGRNTELNNHTTTPQPVLGALNGNPVKQLSVGAYHACAIRTNDLAYCWGSGLSGQIGHGASANAPVATAVSTAVSLNGLTVKYISAGRDQTCAIASNNKAYCWGNDEHGELGDGTYGSSRNVPYKVSETGALDGKNLVKIETGMNHTCAIDEDGFLYCWGSNEFGQIGINGTMSPSTRYPYGQLVPASYFNNKKIKDISLGIYHTCAIDEDGKAYCFGRNDYGQIGINSVGGSYNTPQAVVSGEIGTERFFALSKNTGMNNATCGITYEDRVYCWGLENSGMMTINNPGQNHLSPVMIDEL